MVPEHDTSVRAGHPCRGAISNVRSPVAAVPAGSQGAEKADDWIAQYRAHWADAAREARGFIKRAGGDSTWDRFGEYLEQMQGRDGVLLINRSFAADQKTLFEMWVDPDRILTTVTFTPEGEEDTRVTVRWEILGDATAVERDTFESMRTSMTPGWTGAFEKLEAMLAARIPHVSR